MLSKKGVLAPLLLVFNSFALVVCSGFPSINSAVAGPLSPIMATPAESESNKVILGLSGTTRVLSIQRATMAGVVTDTATSTVRSSLTPGAVRSSSPLDRLVENKPSVSGHKSFYIIIVVLYIVMLSLFLREILGLDYNGESSLK